MSVLAAPDAPAAAPAAAAPAAAALDTDALDTDAPDAPDAPDAEPVPVVRGVPPRVVPERWTVPDEVLSAVRASASRPIGERIEAASRSFLGLPYLNDAAGEGSAEDPDPPSRYDAFDCLTFVEEVLGLALAADPLYAPAIRDALRYRGPRTHASRRHFMEAEWIPDAIANGLLVDITARVGRARVLEKDVTSRMWKSWRRTPLFRLPEARLPVGAWTLPYLDLAEAEAAVPNIPAGALIVTVRADRGIPVVVTHISVAIPGETPDAPLRMRHATRMGSQKVRDDRLEWYAVHIRDYVRWPALGISVLMPREQGPRISALTGYRVPTRALAAADGPLPAFVPKPLDELP